MNVEKFSILNKRHSAFLLSPFPWISRCLCHSSRLRKGRGGEEKGKEIAYLSTYSGGGGGGYFNIMMKIVLSHIL
jgi:hypothetical protein